MPFTAHVQCGAQKFMAVLRIVAAGLFLLTGIYGVIIMLLTYLVVLLGYLTKVKNTGKKPE